MEQVGAGGQRKSEMTQTLREESRATGGGSAGAIVPRSAATAASAPGPLRALIVQHGSEEGRMLTSAQPRRAPSPTLCVQELPSPQDRS